LSIFLLYLLSAPNTNSFSILLTTRTCHTCNLIKAKARIRAIGPVCFNFLPPEVVADCQTLSFSVCLYKNHFSQNCPNQREHRIGRVVTILESHHFLHPKPCRLFYLLSACNLRDTQILFTARFPPNQILRKTLLKKN
jgi:hypothetical protein